MAVVVVIVVLDVIFDDVRGSAYSVGATVRW
jgi:hypothetical protein